MKNAFEIILSIFTVSICLAAFIYSAIKLSKKNSSRYFVFLNLATGCYAIQEICADIYYFIGNGNFDSFATSNLGFIGCVLFILAANLAILEKKIEKSEAVKKANMLSFIGPIVVLIFNVLFYVFSKDISLAFLGLVISLPFYPVTFFAIKHILLSKEVEVCRKTIKTNIIVLIFLLTNLVYINIFFFASTLASDIVSLILGIEVTILSLYCVKEAKQWQI